MISILIINNFQSIFELIRTLKIIELSIFLDPIANVNIKGKVWLQEGEMLNLLVIKKSYYS